jgi:hypothetical protein
MSAQGLIVAVLVVLAAAYVFRALAPRRWLWRLGIGRRTGTGPGAPGAGTGGGSCGCSDCPPVRKPRQP